MFCTQVEELRSRLTKEENLDTPGNTTPAKRNTVLSNGVNGSPPALPEKPLCRLEVLKDEDKGTPVRDTLPATGVIVCF